MRRTTIADNFVDCSSTASSTPSHVTPIENDLPRGRRRSDLREIEALSEEMSVTCLPSTAQRRGANAVTIPTERSDKNSQNNVLRSSTPLHRQGPLKGLSNSSFVCSPLEPAAVDSKRSRQSWRRGTDEIAKKMFISPLREHPQIPLLSKEILDKHNDDMQRVQKRPQWHYNESAAHQFGNPLRLLNWILIRLATLCTAAWSVLTVTLPRVVSFPVSIRVNISATGVSVRFGPKLYEKTSRPRSAEDAAACFDDEADGGECADTALDVEVPVDLSSSDAQHRLRRLLRRSQRRHDSLAEELAVVRQELKSLQGIVNGLNYLIQRKDQQE